MANKDTKVQIERLLDRIAALEKANDDLREENKRYVTLVEDLRRADDRKDQSVSNLTRANLTLMRVVDTLCHDRVAENDEIEFAAVKTYRDGWKYMYLNGRRLEPTIKDNVTIWASMDERVQVDIESR